MYMYVKFYIIIHAHTYMHLYLTHIHIYDIHAQHRYEDQKILINYIYISVIIVTEHFKSFLYWTV